MSTGALHPAWAAAFDSNNPAFEIWLKNVPSISAEAAAAPGFVPIQPQLVTVEPSGSPESPFAPTPTLAAVAVPLTGTDLVDGKRLSSRLSKVAPKLSTEIGSDLDDVAKLLHPEWHSGLDTPIQGLAVFASSMEFWQALQDHNQTQQLLCGAQLGTNMVDLVLGATENLASASGSAAIHGCCLFVRAATGIAKICVESRDKA
jgi:hypothetical protein